MKQLSFLSLLLLLLICACMKEDKVNTPLDGSIVFGVKTYSVETTKGTPITSASEMIDMGVIAYHTGNGSANTWADKNTTATANFLNNVKVSNSSGAWSTANKIYWPQAADANVTFFAYSPYAVSATNGITITNTTGTPTLTYTVPTTCTNQPDLMIAVPCTDLNSTNTTGAVSFSMKHALTCVGFKVGGNNGQSVTKIVLKGVSVSGTLSLDGTTVNWSNLSSVSNTEYVSGIKSSLTACNTMVDAMNADGYLMMIPQTLGTNAKLIVTVDGNSKEISLSGQTWTPGDRIMYNIGVISDHVEITNGGMTRTWATGNLVADGSGGCKIGAPEDGGLYFQFGSLVGWSGSGTDAGTGRGTGNALSQVVLPTGYTGGTGWNADWVGADVAPEASKPAKGTNVANGIGDPCRYYLGSTWRLPTTTEIQALFGNVANGTVWSSVPNWDKQGTFSAGSNNSYGIFTSGSTTLKIPASGCRQSGVADVGLAAKYWTSSIAPNSDDGKQKGYVMLFTSANVNPEYRHYSRFNGHSIRCVQSKTWRVTFSANGGGGTAPSAQEITKGSSATLPDVSSMTPPANTTLGGWATSADATSADFAAGASYTPTDDITLYAVWYPSVAITNGGMTRTWTTGNLVADGNGGCKIGAPEDGGLYFQFGSLIGWSGGATGDGTGRGTDNLTPALSVVVNNTGSGPDVNSTSWVATAGTTYWDGASGTVPLTRTGAVGDPCRYYLGSPWRLPTSTET